MADIEKLKRAIDNSGMTKKAISEKSGILLPTLYKRLEGVGEITASEIVGLTRALRLTTEERDEIFLG